MVRNIDRELDPLGGEGARAIGNTEFPFVPGSLRIEVNDLDWTDRATELEPAKGSYELSDAPPPGATVSRSYQTES